MAHPFAIDAVHHIALTVTDVPRSVTFYTENLGFQVLAPFGDRILINSGNLVVALVPTSDALQAAGDVFDENRVGLDHVSLNIGNRAAMDAAAAYFDANGVARAEIKELEPFGICVMVVRDPDNIQLELTATLT